jgi:hypothetical protein
MQAKMNSLLEFLLLFCLLGTLGAEAAQPSFITFANRRGSHNNHVIANSCSSSDKRSNIVSAQFAFRGGTIAHVDHRVPVDDEQLLAAELLRCEGEIIDPHLHIAPWFNSSQELMEELTASNVSIGLLYNPYPKMSLPFDLNTYVHSIVAASNKKLFMLASLNTTHDNWADHREEELERLKSFLEKEDGTVLGAKLAPPNTCLSMKSPIIADVVETVAQSTNKKNNKLIAIHIGTTPFCGPIGESFGIKCLGDEEYVDPTLLIPHIETHPDIRFALLHSGHEFLPPDSPWYYNFTMTDKCIAMAQTYPNVYLSISALFAQTPDGTMKYPGGEETVRKMKDANVCAKVFWGSDASYNKGQIRPVLISAIKAMVKAGWTEEERSWTLRGCAREFFNLPPP